MLDDQTRTHRDFNRLEEHAKKDNTCDAEVSYSQNLSKVRRSGDKYRIEIFCVKNRQSCLEEVCVRERERERNIGLLILHPVSSIGPTQFDLFLSPCTKPGG